MTKNEKFNYIEKQLYFHSWNQTIYKKREK